MKKIFLILLASFFLICFPVLVNSEEVVSLENPLNLKTDNPAQIIGIVIKGGLSVIGGVALVMMVYGGFQWLTSAGNEEKVKNGTQTMLWSAIGLILIFSSYLLVNTIFTIINSK